MFFHTFFKILLFYSSLVHGIFADQHYDYAAKISLQNVQSSDNRYFAVRHIDSLEIIETLPFSLNDCSISLYDYWIGNDSYTNNLFNSSLCASLLFKQDPVYKDELRYKVLSQFLFPKQSKCPMKKSESIVPAMVEMSFNVWNFDLPCETWIYRQEILRQDKSLLKLNLKMNMLPKYKCGSSSDESSTTENERYHQFVVTNPENKNEIETQIEAPKIDVRMGNFDLSTALSNVQFEEPSNFFERSRGSGDKLISVPRGEKTFVCLREESNGIEKPMINEIHFEDLKNCKWFTLQIMRNCITVFIYEVVKTTEILVYTLL